MPIAHHAAVHAVQRRRQEKKHSSKPPSVSKASTERKKTFTEEHQRQGSLREVMKKYDVDKNGKLEEEQLRKLLTDTNATAPPGTPPTDEELTFILKVADVSQDGTLDYPELEYALKAWCVYNHRRTEMEQKMAQFDKNGSGALGRDELTEMLTSLNDGNPVDKLEVDWVMAEADVIGDGEIQKTELIMACAAWYSHVDKAQLEQASADKQKSSKMCTIL